MRKNKFRSPFFRIIFLLTLIFYLSACSRPKGKIEKVLFPIIENGKTGFIDSTAKIVIAPQFISHTGFSENLCAVRTGGYYGYIDTIGNFIIEQSYDYATPFKEGLAIVYKNGRAGIINASGKQISIPDYAEISSFSEGFAVVKTNTNHYGLINKMGKVFLDTLYSEISGFKKGLCIVQSEKKSKEDYYKRGIIDSTGHWLVEMGTYDGIEDFEGDFIPIHITPERSDTVDGSTAKDGYLDDRARPVYLLDRKNNRRLVGPPSCGLARVYLYKYWLQEKEGVSYSSDKTYQGFCNSKGTIVISDTSFRRAQEFSENHSFVENHEGRHSIINRRGQIIMKDAFKRVSDCGFKNGVALVSIDSDWGLVDTTGKFILTDTFDRVDEIGIVDGFFFIKEEKKGEDSEVYGIVDVKGKVILKPIMQDFDRAGFQHGLLLATINNKKVYINKKGKIAWQEKEKLINVENLNIDYMTRGFFYAREGIADMEYEMEGNYAFKIDKDFLKDSFYIFVDFKNEKNIWQSTYNGLSIYLVNSMTKKRVMNAQDGRLDMKIQAIDSQENWKDIDYLPSSWCGNSYHTLTLYPNEYWKFIIPIYNGEIKTKFRIVLTYIDPQDVRAYSKETEHSGLNGMSYKTKELTLYSNVFDGYINPGQLWRKRRYESNSLMYPYMD